MIVIRNAKTDFKYRKRDESSKTKEGTFFSVLFWGIADNVHNDLVEKKKKKKRRRRRRRKFLKFHACFITSSLVVSIICLSDFLLLKNNNLTTTSFSFKTLVYVLP